VREHRNQDYTGIKFSQSDWWALIDNMRTNFNGLRDSILFYVRVIHKISDMHCWSKFGTIKVLLC